MIKERIRMKVIIGIENRAPKGSSAAAVLINYVRRISDINCCPSNRKLQSTFGHGRRSVLDCK